MDTVRIVSSGDSRERTGNDAIVLANDVIAILESCRDRERRMVDADDWNAILKRGPCVHLVFTRPLQIDTAAQKGIRVSQILIPTKGSWTGMVLVREGDTFRSPFSAYDAELFKRIEQGMR